MAETSWRRSPTTWTGGSGSSSSMVMRRCSAAAADPLDGLGHHQVDVDRLAGRGLLGLDAAEVEQVVDDPADPEGLGVDARGQPLGDLGVGLHGQGLGQQAQGPDGGLQLVADVGHEVAADLLEPAALRHVLDDGDDAERPSAVVDQPGAHGEGLAGRTVEVEGALGRALLPGVLQQLGHGLGGQGVAVAVVHEGHGPGVAEGDLAVLVAHDDPLGAGCRGPGAAGWRPTLASVTASAASPVTFSRWLRTGSMPPSSGGSTPSRLDRAVSRCWRAAPAGPPARSGGDDHGHQGHHPRRRCTR